MLTTSDTELQVLAQSAQPLTSNQTQPQQPVQSGWTFLRGHVAREQTSPRYSSNPRPDSQILGNRVESVEEYYHLGNADNAVCDGPRLFQI